MASPGLLTTTEVAVRTGVSARTIARWADTGKLDIAQRLPGPVGAYLFSPDVVDALASKIRAERTAALEAVK